MLLPCKDMGVNVKTIKRWKIDTEDKRQGSLSAPANKLTAEEVAEIVRVSTCREYMDLPPRQIVPSLADKGIYIASEFSFYKVLREHKLLEHRWKSK